MKKRQENMIKILEQIAKKNRNFAVKVDFEAEGTRLNELASLSKIVFKSGGKLFVKIGGCGAVSDLQFSRDFGADAVMAPMIESAYSLKKFRAESNKIFKDCLKDMEFIANAETKTCLKNFDEILSVGDGFLKGVTIGRVDFCQSLGFDRSNIDDEKILDLYKIFAIKAKEKGLIVSVGGGILKSSFHVLEKIKDFVDRFETRKFVFEFDGIYENFEENILKATEFEVQYLKSKSLKYEEISKEDLKRLDFLEKRL